MLSKQLIISFLFEEETLGTYEKKYTKINQRVDQVVSRSENLEESDYGFMVIYENLF